MKIIFNQKYIITFKQNKIKIYESYFISKINLVLKFSSDESITDIQFHPLLDNIILVSFFKGFCKIYEIDKQNLQEKIKFEGINEQMIEISKFNYLDTNIIASLSNSKIIIWDVRNIKYINVIKIQEERKRIEENEELEELEELEEIEETEETEETEEINFK